MPAPAVSPIIAALVPLREAAADLAPVEVATSFLAMLAAVPDPRRAQGRRHPLPAILGLAICAVLADADNYLQIAAWITDAEQETLTAFGAGEQAASESVIRKTLQRLDGDAFDVATCAWIEEQAVTSRRRARRIRRLRVPALDGKTLRGSATSATPGRHLLAVYNTDTATVSAQVEVGAKTNEITRFATVLDSVDLTGAVVTADALHAQRAHATYLITQRGGHYLLTVKRNQPHLYEYLAALPWNSSPIQAASDDRDHGRSEERYVKAIELKETLGFTGAVQAVRIVRRRLEHSSGKQSIEIVYAITSLNAVQAGVHDLADYVRWHWHVENRLHHIRDVTFHEDASRVHTGNGPRVMASIRNLVLGVLRLAGEENIAAARARLARRPGRPIRLLRER